MKNIILGSVLAIAAVTSLPANAANAVVCSGVNAAGNGSVTGTADGTSFVRQGFTMKCSANVFLTGDDQVTYYRVGAASAKGKNTFKGSSAGGAVSADVACSVSGACTQTDANTAAGNAASS